MNKLSNGIRPCRGKTKVVEIVGPAGAGKTTLYRALDCYTDFIRLENFPDVRKAADAPFFILNGIRLIPSLLHLYRSNSRQLTRREFAWMSILIGWSHLLRRESSDDDKVIILDQGPVYLLTEMRLFGPEYLRQNAAQPFWQSLYERWGATLDMVVYLDATNDVLLNRIRSRQQEHTVKKQSPTVVFEFLNSYRTEYEFLLSQLPAKKAALKVLQFDTEQQRPQEIVNQFMSELSG
jgi:adenylate kinase family enzyme